MFDWHLSFSLSLLIYLVVSGFCSPWSQASGQETMRNVSIFKTAFTFFREIGELRGGLSLEEISDIKSIVRPD
jgi:hypothetical protein